MARYTDIDKLIAEYDRVHIGPPGGARKLIEDAPIADVVPRDEEEMHGLSYYFKLEQAIESSQRFIAEHDAALAKKIFEEIERNIFILETPYQTLHCIPSGFIEELKEKYTKGGEE